MSPPEPVAQKYLSGPVGVAVGLLLAAGAWLLPVNLKSVSPALLRGAGEEHALRRLKLRSRQLVDVGKNRAGPRLVAAAARAPWAIPAPRPSPPA